MHFLRKILEVVQGATEEQATQIQTNTNNISELKEDISLLSKEIVDKVKGDGIANIVKLTQSEYDSMASHDENTLYVIVG